MARLGCLVLIVIVGVLAWLNRDRWLHRTPATPPAPSGAVVAASDWSPLTEAGAQRTRTALTKLSSASGPVFVTLSGADVASYIASAVAKQMPPSTDSVTARVVNDQVSVRAIVNTKDVGKSGLGMIGSLLGDREPVEMSGTLRVIGKGMAEFLITGAKIHDITLPSAVISRLVKPLVKGARPAGLDEDALPVSIPSYIGDVRVANGKITLYKNVQ